MPITIATLCHGVIAIIKESGIACTIDVLEADVELWTERRAAEAMKSKQDSVGAAIGVSGRDAPTSYGIAEASHPALRNRQKVDLRVVRPPLTAAEDREVATKICQDWKVATHPRPSLFIGAPDWSTPEFVAKREAILERLRAVFRE